MSTIPESTIVHPFLQFCHGLEEASSLDDFARSVTSEVARALGADRAAFFHLDADRVDTLANVNLSGAPAVAIGAIVRRCSDDIPQLGGCVVTSTEAAPEIAARLQEGGATVAACAFFATGRGAIGALYCDSTVPGRTFPQYTSFLLKTLAVFARPVFERLRGEPAAPESAPPALMNIDDYDLLSIVGRSPALQSVLVKIAQVASMNIPVLIEGESGTGKELLARALHMNGDRRNGPFIALNCGAIPEQLLASELFGYERGAFTGAARATAGKFEAAHTGTLFLDEVSELPSGIQVALLRILQSGEYYRLGSSSARHTGARVVAATNRMLLDLVKEKGFREDLYYRLNVVRIVVPPLRERREDIPLLVAHFLRRFSAETKREIRTVSDEALRALLEYPFPGNVRELENAIRAAIVTTVDDTIRLDDLPPEVRSERAPGHSQPLTMDEVRRAQDRIEREFIERLLRESRGNISEAAKAAGLNRTYLHALINRHGISVEAFRPARLDPAPL